MLAANNDRLVVAFYLVLKKVMLCQSDRIGCVQMTYHFLVSPNGFNYRLG